MNLKQYRKSLGLTQEQAGAKMGGMSKQRWGQLEKAWPMLAVDTVMQIVQAFGAQVSITMDGKVRFLTDAEQEELNRPATQEELADAIKGHNEAPLDEEE